VVAFLGDLDEKIDVPRVSFNESVSRVIVVGLGHRTILRQVVETEDGVTSPKELLHNVPTDESG
jgi:hypothetical protein